MKGASLRLWTVRLCFLLLTGSSIAAFGQTAPPVVTAAQDQAAIAGAVTDQTGAVLPGATVTVAGAAGLTRTATTNDQGAYSINNLPAGTYGITVSAPHFKDFHTDNLILGAGQRLPFDATLEPAVEKTSLNVEGQKVSQVETETSQIVGTVTQRELVSLGLNGRNFTQLIALTPGVSNQTGQDEAKVGVLGSVRYGIP